MLINMLLLCTTVFPKLSKLLTENSGFRKLQFRECKSETPKKRHSFPLKDMLTIYDIYQSLKCLESLEENTCGGAV